MSSRSPKCLCAKQDGWSLCAVCPFRSVSETFDASYLGRTPDEVREQGVQLTLDEAPA